MPWIVSGSCNDCGICCLSMELGGSMLENPCIELGQDRCLFYTDDVDPDTRFGHCLILQANRNYNRVRDRFGNKITDAQIRWFEENCPLFPTTLEHLQDLLDGSFELPPECGYELTEVP